MTTTRGGTTMAATLRHFSRLRSKRSELLVLDGGTGEELFRRGVPDDRQIWSATAVVNDNYHVILKDVHKSFINAGSHAITTNSYGVVPGVGFSVSDIAKYVATAGRLAREAVAESALHDGQSALVLGSLPPLLESYRPDKVMKHIEGVQVYSVFVKALTPFVDCFLAETMSSVEEASQAIESVGLGNESELPMLVSFTLNSAGLIRSGESAVDSVPRIIEFAKENNVHLLGILFNCSEPEAITKALQSMRLDKNVQHVLSENKIILGAYANRLTPVRPDWSLEESDGAQPFRTDLSPKDYCNDFASVWTSELGVQMIGGCCGITPEHVLYLSSHLPSK